MPKKSVKKRYGRYNRILPYAVNAAKAAYTAARSMYKKRGAGSKTKTKKNKVMKTVKQSSFSTFSRAAHRNKLTSRTLKMVSRQNVKYQRSTDATARLTSLVGRQSVNDVAYLINAVDLGTMLTQMSGTVTGRWFIGRCQQITEFHNQSNSGVKMWIYDLQCKRDDCAAPSACWNTGLSDEGAAANSYLNPYAYPQASKQFLQNWKVEQVTRLGLEAGQSHTHTFDYALNKAISQDQYETCSTFKAGFTHATMVVVLGALDNDSTTKSQISFGVAAVNTYIRYKWNWSNVTANAISAVHTNGLPSAFTISESTMLEDADVAAVVTSA